MLTDEDQTPSQSVFHSAEEVRIPSATVPDGLIARKYALLALRSGSKTKVTKSPSQVALPSRRMAPARTLSRRCQSRAARYTCFWS